MLSWLDARPATLVYCCAARCCLRRACTYSGGDPEHCLIPISSCCGLRPSKAANSLRALVPFREIVFDSTVASEKVCVTLLRIFAEYFTPHFCGVLYSAFLQSTLLRIFAEYFSPQICGVIPYSAFIPSSLGQRVSPRFPCSTRS